MHNLPSLGKTIRDTSGRISFYLTAKQAAATSRTFNNDKLDKFFAFIADMVEIGEASGKITSFSNDNGTEGVLYPFNGHLSLNTPEGAKEIKARLEIRIIYKAKGLIENASIKLYEGGLTLSSEMKEKVEALKSKFVGFANPKVLDIDEELEF